MFGYSPITYNYLNDNSNHNLLFLCYHKMSNLPAIIKSRRAVYPMQMNGESVPTSVIHEMLELANWAPTHRNTEPWRFKVYEQNAKDSLLDLCKECYVKTTPAEKFKSVKLDKIEKRKNQVSHIVAICMRRNEESAVVPEWEEVAATAMAAQNMWLALSESGKYGGYWSSSAYAMGDGFRNFLKLSDDERCLGLFYVGTIADTAVLTNGRRGDWREKVSFEK